uniref:Photosystem II stability/assembly factor HCF136ic-like isoform X1 n=1 Tax=Rhizophora mucronata TaxID=61149 RepID=A0A2P2KVG1_RHIMU
MTLVLPYGLYNACNGGYFGQDFNFGFVIKYWSRDTRAHYPESNSILS